MEFVATFKDHLGKTVGERKIEAADLHTAVKDLVTGPGPTPWPPSATTVDVVGLVP